jgi:hypothetical protein
LAIIRTGDVIIEADHLGPVVETLYCSAALFGSMFYPDKITAGTRIYRVPTLVYLKGLSDLAIFFFFTQGSDCTQEAHNHYTKLDAFSRREADFRAGPLGAALQHHGCHQSRGRAN